MSLDCEILAEAAREQILAELSRLTFFEELLIAQLAAAPHPCPDYESQH